MRLLLLNADPIILCHDCYLMQCQGITFLQMHWPMPSRCEHIAMKPARKLTDTSPRDLLRCHLNLHRDCNGEMADGSAAVKPAAELLASSMRLLFLTFCLKGHSHLTHATKHLVHVFFAQQPSFLDPFCAFLSSHPPCHCSRGNARNGIQITA